MPRLEQSLGTQSFPASQRSSLGDNIINNNISNSNNFSRISFRASNGWSPPEDVEKGIMADEGVPSKITKMNGKQIDLVSSFYIYK